MPDIYDLADQHRAALLANERAAAVRMVDAYQQASDAINESLQRLLSQMEQARPGDKRLTTTWLLRQGRLETLQAQAQAELLRFAQMAAGSINTQQREAAEAGQRDAREQAAEAGVNWNRLPTEALTDLVGFLGDGSPVMERLQKAAIVGALEARSALIRGVAQGKGPRKIAGDVRKATGLALSSALTIARTETLRAYRESTRRGYEANSDIVIGWRWLCALGSRTCPVCVAMHGQIRPLSERFGTHPNCRCTMVAVLRGQESEPFETGEEWLTKQSATAQETILGKAGAAAWRSGLPLSDFVHTSKDPAWGLVRSVRPLGKGKSPAFPASNAGGPPSPMTDAEMEAAWLDLTTKFHGELQTALRQSVNPNMISRWNGTVKVIEDSRVTGDHGGKDWSCSISYSRDSWEDSVLFRYHLCAHESLHGFSPGLTKPVYDLYPAHEEGLVEQIWRMLRGRLITAIGENPDDFDFTEDDKESPYAPYVEFLEVERGETDKQQSEFYYTLFNTPLGQREDLIDQWKQEERSRRMSRARP